MSLLLSVVVAVVLLVVSVKTEEEEKPELEASIVIHLMEDKHCREGRRLDNGGRALMLCVICMSYLDGEGGAEAFILRFS